LPDTILIQVSTRQCSEGNND